METIVALASARGRAGVAVVRVSGERAWDVCAALAGDVPHARRATVMVLRDAAGLMIDQALVLVFEEGHSFTSERVCEFQVHGGAAVVSAVLRTCMAQPGVRAAEAGEFTRRAFMAGRMDLTEVEALADLIDAETEAQRLQALRVLDGSAGAAVAAWRDDLLQALTILEAALDFADEELPSDLADHVEAPLQRVLLGLEAQLRGRNAAEAVRDGFEVALIGRVNAGKSTLLNWLAGREAAITSDQAGTTRDVIEVRMDIAGLPVTLIDTAGLRDTEDPIERLGIERGRARADAADLRVFLLSDPLDEPQGVRTGDIVVLSKADLWGADGVSGRTGEGMEDLLKGISAQLAERCKGSSLFSRERHFDKLERALLHLVEARRLFGIAGTPWEFVSEEVRSAIRCLDGIIGRVDVEDVLGRIFSSFCIGK